MSKKKCRWIDRWASCWLEELEVPHAERALAIVPEPEDNNTFWVIDIDEKEENFLLISAGKNSILKNVISRYFKIKNGGDGFWQLENENFLFQITFASDIMFLAEVNLSQVEKFCNEHFVFLTSTGQKAAKVIATEKQREELERLYRRKPRRENGESKQILERLQGRLISL